MTDPSYIDFVRFRAQTNPCISRLSQQLRHGSRGRSRIVFLDYPHGAPCQAEPESSLITEDGFLKAIRATPPATARFIFIENISSNLITLAGTSLDIDPLFFADYVHTSFEDIEKAPPPPSLAILPSLIAKTGHVHLHYQQVVDLGSTDAFSNVSYALKTDSNSPRNVRRLAPLSGRQLALARSCCSFLIKTMNNSSICEYPSLQ